MEPGRPKGNNAFDSEELACIGENNFQENMNPITSRNNYIFSTELIDLLKHNMASSLMFEEDCTNFPCEGQKRTAESIKDGDESSLAIHTHISRDIINQSIVKGTEIKIDNQCSFCTTMLHMHKETLRTADRQITEKKRKIHLHITIAMAHELIKKGIEIEDQCRYCMAALNITKRIALQRTKINSPVFSKSKQEDRQSCSTTINSEKLNCNKEPESQRAHQNESDLLFNEHNFYSHHLLDAFDHICDESMVCEPTFFDESALLATMLQPQFAETADYEIPDIDMPPTPTLVSCANDEEFLQYLLAKFEILNLEQKSNTLVPESPLYKSIASDTGSNSKRLKTLDTMMDDDWNPSAESLTDISKGPLLSLNDPMLSFCDDAADELALKAEMEFLDRNPLVKYIPEPTANRCIPQANAAFESTPFYL